uniref:Uncharacterized protein n=1 Tax=Oreochromis niloticus TaxID=8128 RepID=A0A669ECA1_ORENI
MANRRSDGPDPQGPQEGTVKAKDGDVHKDIVRGTKNAEYHNHIFEKVDVVFLCCKESATLQTFTVGYEVKAFSYFFSSDIP